MIWKVVGVAGWLHCRRLGDLFRFLLESLLGLLMDVSYHLGICSTGLPYLPRSCNWQHCSLRVRQVIPLAAVVVKVDFNRVDLWVSQRVDYASKTICWRIRSVPGQLFLWIRPPTAENRSDSDICPIYGSEIASQMTCARRIVRAEFIFLLKV